MEQVPQAVGLTDAQFWAIAAALVALLIAILVSVLLAGGARSGSRRDVDDVRGQLRDQNAQLGDRIEQIRTRADALDRQVAFLATRTALLHAAAKGTRARTHLSEQESGLAERDLNEADNALGRALESAPADLRPRIDEARRALHDLKQGVEARTFPVAAVEMVVDRIEGLIGHQETSPAGQEPAPIPPAEG